MRDHARHPHAQQEPQQAFKAALKEAKVAAEIVRKIGEALEELSDERYFDANEFWEMLSCLRVSIPDVSAAGHKVEAAYAEVQEEQRAKRLCR